MHILTFDFDTSKDVKDFLRPDFLLVVASTVVVAVLLLHKEQSCCAGSLIRLDAACSDEEDFSMFSLDVVVLASSLFKPNITFDLEVIGSLTTVVFVFTLDRAS